MRSLILACKWATGTSQLDVHAFKKHHRTNTLALGLQWACTGLALGLHWIYIGAAMGLHWACIELALGFQWACDGLAMSLQ
eukprot:1892581-Alexandrium_andersonii.AAC.1